MDRGGGQESLETSKPWDGKRKQMLKDGSAAYQNMAPKSEIFTWQISFSLQVLQYKRKCGDLESQLRDKSLETDRNSLTVSFETCPFQWKNDLFRKKDFYCICWYAS